MKRNSPLRRYKPPRRVRKRVGEETVGKTGRIRLRGKKLEQLRRDCFTRDGGICVWKGCGKSLLWESGYLNSMHMAHIIARSRGGSDILSNVRSLCPFHHIECEHNGIKEPE